MLITLEERFALLTQQMEEASGEKAREDERSPEATLHDMADPSFWAASPIYEPEAKRGLIVRRTLVAAPLEDATDEQRENLFESRCLINGKVYNFIIDSGSCTNVVALSLVDSLELPTQDHPKPYKLSWLNDDGGVRVKKRALVGFRVGGYMDKMWFDVVPMTACSLLLGSPWQYDRQVLHHGRDNVYSVLVDGARVGLKPLPPKRSLIPMPKESASSVQDGGGHVCLQSCRDEMLETASTKKARRASVLHLRQDSRLSEGDYVWLSLSAQKLHIDHKNDEPMDEGPFKVVKKLGFDTYKVQLGRGICATLGGVDLVPCLEDP
ncbi:uncharacterized protein LOC125499577 [Beta vulgaris subsp. vulgaris]|uniref:uncharacterized protein LOC125499577 n=1 Tax=Beta vulgaris subsp. vulgaris TaxID=3555 RepID=UPI0025475C4C|nr:uncharacterized protein LOC125499577 [Beta vulgaris subsp. vulgaris]